MPLHGEYAPGPEGWAREQAELIESSAGLAGTTIGGMPVVVLTTVGAKSGMLRKTALMRVEHDGVYAIVASSGKAWYRNVLQDPRVELQDGPVRHDYVAREVVGDERALWWARAVDAFPPYATMQDGRDQEIPVFVLDRA